jgi:hypothetical protein
VADATAYRVYWSFTAGVTPFNGTRIEVVPTRPMSIPTGGGHRLPLRGDRCPSTGVESGRRPGRGRPGQPADLGDGRGPTRDAELDGHRRPEYHLHQVARPVAGSPYRITNLENDTWLRLPRHPAVRAATAAVDPRATPRPPRRLPMSPGRDHHRRPWRKHDHLTPVLGATSHDVSWWSLNAGSPTSGCVLRDRHRLRHAGLNTCLGRPDVPCILVPWRCQAEARRPRGRRRVDPVPAPSRRSSPTPRA